MLHPHSGWGNGSPSAWVRLLPHNVRVPQVMLTEGHPHLHPPQPMGGCYKMLCPLLPETASRWCSSQFAVFIYF